MASHDSPPSISTLGQLQESGYRSRTIKQEMRANLKRALAGGDKLFPGVIGYDKTVTPALVNSLLAGHDFILLGLRGQAKTRLLRGLVHLLDPFIPALDGCQLNDDPLAPISVTGQRLIEELGKDAPIRWIPRQERYNEKLATPDVSIADLLGDIDPIKAATQGLTFADPEVIHFGIVPRTNRGIFAINELPDLAPRIQVGLLNILEERDLQIRGFPIRIPLDIQLVFSANPEDYTNRGSIITPLKDRIASQILTHYPSSRELAASITHQEAFVDRDNSAETADEVKVPKVVVPELGRLFVEEISIAARESDLVDQSSGVSARVAISALELLHSNLERRGLITGDDPVFPRLSDFHMLLPAITGKVEIVYEGEQKGVEVVVRQIVGQAAKTVFLDHFDEVGREVGSGGEDDTSLYSKILAWFSEGNEVALSDSSTFDEHLAVLKSIPEVWKMVESKAETDQERAFLAELVLEGLHQHVKLARQDLDSQISYRELLKFQLLRS